ncbi:MAG: hypothetical protein WDN28_29890 [Chthoniobacter sp.]
MPSSLLAAPANFVFDPILPIAAVALLGAALAVLTLAIYRRVGTRLSAAQNGTLLLFRLLGGALVLLLLLQPSRLEEIPPPVTNRVTLVAVDDSRSMAQQDVEQGTRSQAARALLADAGLIKPDGTPADHDTRLYQFGEDAAPIKSTNDLQTAGPSTRVHRSISTILSSLGANDSARALLVFSDGHDFELTNPAKTGFLARQRGVPIYAVPLGKQGTVRDVSVRITSYQPYCYVKQKARISGALRLIGCELETLNVELVRGDQVVQTQRLHAGDEPEVAVNFDVTEPAVGQYEYEIRVTPLPGEVDAGEQSRADLSQRHRPADPGALPRGLALLGHHFPPAFADARRQDERRQHRAVRRWEGARGAEEARRDRTENPRGRRSMAALRRGGARSLGGKAARRRGAASARGLRQEPRRHRDLQPRARLRRRNPE